MSRRLPQKLALAVEIPMTVGICAGIVVSSIGNLKNRAETCAMQTDRDYQNLVNRYVSVFKAITIPVREQIQAGLSLSEMNAWLQSRMPNTARPWAAKCSTGLP
jgi:hypothetical protein